MKYILYSLLFVAISVSAAAQCGGSNQPPCNPGFFEVRGMTNGLTQYVVQMRAVGAVVPARSTCSGFPPAIQNNIIADLVFAVKWPASAPVLGMLPQTVAPCTCSGGTCSGGGGGYSIDIGIGPLLGTGGVFDVQGFGASNTPYGTPVNWVLNEWVSICTLDIFFEDAPIEVDFQVYAHGDDPTLEIGASIAPNFNFAVTPPGQDYTMAVDQVLPLDLLVFKAQKYGEYSAILKWTTANEVNTNHILIERSEDRITWDIAGKMQAAGTSTSLLNYEFIDRNIYDGRKANARYYYRLNIVDGDGRSRKSNIDVVQFSSNQSAASVFVFPNPSTDGVNVELNYTADNPAPADMLIYNELGQIVYRQIVPSGSTFEFIDFTKARINAGAYTLQVIDQAKGILATEKLIVQR